MAAERVVMEVSGYRKQRRKTITDPYTLAILQPPDLET